MNLADPRTALNDLLAAVTALKLPLTFADPQVEAFDKVKIFDLQDLAAAMEELFVYSNRIALIALDGIGHDKNVSGRTLTIKRTLTLTIIMADRRYSDRQKAMMGDATTPGALLLQKTLVDAIAGELASGGAVAMPTAGRLIAIENEKRANEPGRIAFAQDFTIAADWDSAALSRVAKIDAA